MEPRTPVGDEVGIGGYSLLLVLPRNGVGARFRHRCDETRRQGVARGLDGCNGPDEFGVGS